jgi:polyvinyl alcohol dehydrogenase (cytochrome)
MTTLLYVGLQSVEEPLTSMLEGFTPDFKGKVMALDASDGSLVWETTLTPDDVDSAGVPVWSTFAVDPLTDTVFFTTGNNYRAPATDLSDSVIAVDARSGEVKWAHQVYTQDI